MGKTIDKVYPYIEEFHAKNKGIKHPDAFKDLVMELPFEQTWKDKASLF